MKYKLQKPKIITLTVITSILISFIIMDIIGKPVNANHADFVEESNKLTEILKNDKTGIDGLNAICEYAEKIHAKPCNNILSNYIP